MYVGNRCSGDWRSEESEVKVIDLGSLKVKEVLRVGLKGNGLIEEDDKVFLI